MTRFFGQTSLLVLVTMLTTAPRFSSQAQENSEVSPLGTNHASVQRSSSKVIVDGFLDGPWEGVPAIGNVVEREPKEGQSPTERTEVKLLYDNVNFYIGVFCYESEPGRIIAAQMSRDADLSSDDRIEIVIDTFNDRRNAFYFATNPAGVLVDGLIIENGQLIKEVGCHLERSRTKVRARMECRDCNSIQESHFSARTADVGL